jgi:DHA1 family tetracycline resistance protein-like MFS transporter
LTDATPARPEDAAPAAPKRAAAKGFIFVTILLDVISFGMIIPVLPMLVLQMEGGDTARAAAIAGIFGTAWAAMQFFCAPILGALSDRYGRRPVLLLSMAGLGIDKIFMALAPNLAILFIGRVISGATAASFSTAAAYLTDITKPEERAKTFGLMNAAFGAGFVLGPALGGILADPAIGALVGLDAEHATRLPFIVAAVLCLVNAAWGFFVLPESLPPGRRSPFAWKRANPLGSLKLLRTSQVLSGLAIVYFLLQLGHHALQSVFALYVNYRYDWASREIGLTLAFVGICSALVSALLIQPVVKAIGERMAMTVGLAFGVLTFLIYAFAPSGYWFLAGIPFGALMGLFGPAAQSLMTRQIQPSAQGQLQGALSSMMGLTGMIGPTLFTVTFSFAIAAGSPLKGLPGLPYLIGAALFAAAGLIAWRVTRAMPRG